MPDTVEVPPKEAERTPGPPERQAPVSPRPPRSQRRSFVRSRIIKFLILLIVLVAAALGGYRLWKYLDSYESTDDAQVDGDIYSITSRISGTVTVVHVEDNQQVKAGQLLVELDPRDYEVVVAQARAALNESRTQILAARPNVPITSLSTETTLLTASADIAGARASLAGAQREWDSAQADIRKAEADNARSQADLARYRQLIAKDEISQLQFDQVDAAAKAATANLDAKKATAEAAARSIEEAQARLEQAETKQREAEQNRPQQIAVQNALLANREATARREQTVLDQALLNVSYTKIFAPVDGVIGKKNVQPGQQVSPGQQLMADVPLNRLWATANFKETQLKRMHPGQRVTLHVDSYDRDYEGVVESVAGASGARFSLLPPENATGNYVKVVQRVPVRIRINEGQDLNHLLRPGMSVEPKVWLDQK